ISSGWSARISTQYLLRLVCTDFNSVSPQVEPRVIQSVPIQLLTGRRQSSDSSATQLFSRG
ncbi:hypothetical protein L9F63_017454, partial [Diploptera punctata]